jgi:hypothetical protein
MRRKLAYDKGTQRYLNNHNHKGNQHCGLSVYLIQGDL